MIVGGAIYLSGLSYYAARDNVASNDPRRFWPALLLWFVVAPIGWINSAVNRM